MSRTDTDSVQSVLEGFATLALVVGLGYLLARSGVTELGVERALNLVAFHVGLPALMVTMLAAKDLSTLFSANLGTAAVSAAVVAAGYWSLSRLLWPAQRAGERTIGTLCAAYVNSGNLGIPISTYVLGNPAYSVPTLLMQTLVMQPVALSVLDAQAGRRSAGLTRRLWAAATNPITAGSLVGLVLSATHTHLPRALAQPTELLGAMAVPSMVLALGMSLHHGGRPGGADVRGPLVVVTVLKELVQPAVAWVAGRFLFGLTGHELLAVVVVAALPTAQNIAVHASRYRTAGMLARDSIVATTLAAVPVIILVVALLHA